ncbi:muscarinic acetylcholine receptor M5b [Poecilia reticulata]|uniref:Muscarinic acetylcholine receptor n=1 Tax=Poecilia reticulata TaxID=8081 RepID=A0A3P9P1I5_POERE|nr:PREDICTED: muscarinic acetylcholine receptor M5-like [Poecilia reticulata]
MDVHNSTLGNGTVPYSLLEVIAIATVSAIVSLITIVGNVLVLLSFKVNSQLKTVNNYYLLSLAFADLIIGVLSMNLYTMYILMDKWPLGNIACDLWLAVDYVASNASVMNLLVISFDRYFSITRPLTYRAKRTPKRAAIMIGLAWLVSFVLWAPPILCWQYFVGRRTVSPDKCEIQFLTEPVITFGTAIAAFYIPVSIMTILYWRIYKETQKRTKDLAELQGLTTGNVPEGNKPQKAMIRSCFHFPRERRDQSQASWSSSTQSNVTKMTSRSDDAWVTANQTTSFNSYTSSEEEEHRVSIETPQGSFKEQQTGQSNKNGEVPDYPEEEFCSTPQKKSHKSLISYKFKGSSKGKNDNPPSPKPCPPEPEQPVKKPSTSSSSTASKPIDSAMKNRITKRKRMVLVKEKKAAQTLSAILLAFILTWTPYNIMVLISAFCSNCIPESLWHLGYWLCYVNSTVNPMCYALCNKTFQKTFRMLLLCQWRKRRRGNNKMN